jgi:hypothetical protein
MKQEWDGNQGRCKKGKWFHNKLNRCLSANSPNHSEPSSGKIKRLRNTEAFWGQKILFLQQELHLVGVEPAEGNNLEATSKVHLFVLRDPWV